MARGVEDVSVGGFEGFDLDCNPAPSSRSVHDSSSSSASIQPSSPRGWPKAQPVLWAADDDPLSPRGPLSPTGSVGSLDSWCSGYKPYSGSPLSLFTVELSATPPAVVRADEIEEGEIVEVGIDSRPPPVHAPIPSAQTPPPVVTLVATPMGSGSVDLRCGLAAFREKCRLKRASLLPRPPPRKPRKKRSPPSVVRRSARVAGRFASGGSIKMQQRILIHQLGIAREGEVISDDALQAYLRFFNEKPMTADHLAACLALFVMDLFFSLLVWNVRGLNSLARCDSIYQVVCLSGASVVCFLETKPQVVTRDTVDRCLGREFDSFFFLPALGTRGGILLAWKSSVVSLSNPHYSNNAITARVGAHGDAGWWITGVYGPQSEVDKCLFLQENMDIRDLHPGPWAVAGDFNLIVDAADKNNTNLNRRMMGKFRRLLTEMELKELYLNGRRYTWSNERERATLERLDRVFSTVDWEVMFPFSFLSAMGSSTSDHCPLLLNLAIDLRVGRRFRFEAFWPKADGFLETVERAWSEGPVVVNPFKRLAAKLAATAKALTSWSDRFIGNNKRQILLANELILRLDVAMESRQLSVEERAFRRLLKRKLLGLASLERTIARQRSRITWLAEGDACTKFFHLHANHRRRKNFIAQLSVDGTLVAEQDKKAEAVDSFYGDLLGAAPERDFSLDLGFLGVQTHDLSELDRTFTEEEIWDVVRSQELDKAPGPDGFSGRFYVACWPIIKLDVMAAFQSLWEGDCRGLHVANQALVSLLPKRADAVEVKDFRPISLIHSVAKLMAKALPSRLAPRMEELVGPQQSAFICGRCLHDNFQLVHHTARKLHVLKRDAILLKLDITKAFDTVDWAFLLEVMSRLGFGRKWTSMVGGLLSSASTHVLVNGQAGALIFNRRGLRQGDPLSPLLFDTVMDVLHLMFERAADVGLLTELSPSGFRHRTSMYADDVVTFIRPTRLDLQTCAQIVEDFGVASGLRTNLAKCSLHPIRCS
ncbi:hypothetical protein ACQ4PT_012157 [Festuca glaucescens]